MTRPLPVEVQAIADHLRTHEGYLWSTIRQQELTCTICVTPTGGPAICDQCERHRSSPHPKADQTGILIYAPYGEQSYHLVKQYKGQSPGPSLPQKIGSLLALGLRGHRECVMHLADTTDMTWAVVPSTKNLNRAQPLRQQMLTFANPERETRLHPTAEIPDPRAFDPTHFRLDPGESIPESTILIDDSWVSGGHAQSAASTLKVAGVRHVAIFAVARVLDPSWPPTANFLQTSHQRRTFDPTRCPWTTGTCP